MKRQALLVTVGVGQAQERDGYIGGLCAAVRAANPDAVTWLVTRESLPHAEEATRLLGLEGGAQYHDVGPAEDLERTFLETQKAVQDLSEKGFAVDEIKIDFTFGTKAMTAGAMLAAIGTGISQVQYVGGERAGGPTVRPGRERVISFRPNCVLASARLNLAFTMMRELMFAPAILILRPLVEGDLLGAPAQEEAQALLAAAQGYDAWERFDYRDAIRHLGGFPRAMSGGRTAPLHLQAFALGEEAKGRLHNLAGLQKNQSRAPVRYDCDRIADLCANAERRAKGGHYDDAVARLYRAAEMLAQWRLQDGHELESGNLVVAKLPPGLQSKYEAKRETPAGHGKPKVSLGLRDAYSLLAELGDELGKAFGQAQEIQNALTARNQSLLAHGVTPVGQQDYEKLRDALLALARSAMGDEFDRARRDLRFPWMK